jgi:hypothetical protein
LDAYLEEELIDLLTFCLQNPTSSYIDSKKQRVQEIGHELFSDGGVDTMENMYFVIEHRIKEEIQKDPRSYRSWWNGISDEWKY